MPVARRRRDRSTCWYVTSLRVRRKKTDQFKSMFVLMLVLLILIMYISLTEIIEVASVSLGGGP